MKKSITDATALGVVDIETMNLMIVNLSSAQRQRQVVASVWLSLQLRLVEHGLTVVTCAWLRLERYLTRSVSPAPDELVRLMIKDLIPTYWHRHAQLSLRRHTTNGPGVCQVP